MFVDNVREIVKRCRDPKGRLSWSTLTGTFGRYVRNGRE